MPAGFSLADGVAGVALACVVIGAVCDVRRFEIPDTLSVVLLVTAAIFGFLHPGFGWFSHIGAALLMFLFGLLAFSRGWLGGGDIKLMTGISAWTGLAGLPLLFVALSLAGGALAILLLGVRKVLSGRDPATLPRVFQSDAPLPYAVAIAAGTLWWAVTAYPPT